MIAHISIGVRDIDRSKRFYDAVLEPLGYKCLRAAKSLVGYGYGRDSIAFWVFRAEHPVPALGPSSRDIAVDPQGGQRSLRSSLDLGGWSRQSAHARHR